KGPVSGPLAASAALASIPSSASPCGPANTLRPSMIRWSSRCISARSRRMRPGPSWGKKDKHCDPTQPEDRELGSWWDHVLIDPDSKLIVTCVVGRRTADTAYAALADCYRRTDGEIEL